VLDYHHKDQDLGQLDLAQVGFQMLVVPRHLHQVVAKGLQVDKVSLEIRDLVLSQLAQIRRLMLHQSAVLLWLIL
jgi:hypothetical protein